ncbi:MAG TPA: class I tRNA ligase family protein [Candidatus Saccharimonadales bacterium]|jgi:leucyl-tRNA synthetase|nr:class I tRNA ligase family protein [Candidatus Saccharimonadales bacterium]
MTSAKICKEFGMSEKFDHKKIEAKWQKRWKEAGIYNTGSSPSKKKYILDMFPYPSGSTMHVGHLEGYVGTDILSRYLRMNGYSVLHPMGWDAFGLPAENYAIKTGIDPDKSTHDNINTFRRQLEISGMSYDWSREIDTSSPEFYKWTQWLFIQLYKKGLTYKKKAPVNWCPKDETVLANEQVVNGKCERCDTPVIQKELDQWFFKITDYADRLISGLDTIDWPEDVKRQQINWIGKKEGAKVRFEIKGEKGKYIEVFTTRPDTIFGATFLVVSPNHPLVNDLLGIGKGVMNYLSLVLTKKDDNVSVKKEKSGVQTSFYGINPVNNEPIPIFISDYVVGEFGTGAIMGVPAHDEDDFEFALKFNIPRRKVVEVGREFQSLVIKKSVTEDFVSKVKKIGGWVFDFQGWGYRIVCNSDYYDEYLKIVQSSLFDDPWYVDTDGTPRSIIFKNRVFKLPEEDAQARAFARELGVPEAQTDWQTEKIYPYCFPSPGIAVNSGNYSGMVTEAIYKRIVEDFKDSIKPTTNYHLRDWLISRQRYWGCPIPMINCDKCGLQPVADSDLPVMLPIDVDFQPHGESPIARSKMFQKDVVCPVCGKPAKREVDTMDTYVDSSWYFIRFADPKNSKEFASPESTKKWLPVDDYVGGGHVVQHLLFARFFWKVLFDAGLVDKSLGDEPFLKLRAPGWILGSDSRKMSKRWGNVVTPDEIIPKFGADTLRLYEMFMGPFDVMKPWSTSGVEGSSRFLGKVWRLFQQPSIDDQQSANDEVVSKLHQTIKKVTKDIEEYKFNTAISSLMELTNIIIEHGADKETLKTFILLLAPFAPHLAEEVWVEILKQPFSIHKANWPKYDDSKIAIDIVTVIVQVNGKMRGTLELATEISNQESEVTQLSKKDEKITKWLEGKEVVKTIFVPGKVINFVVK